MFPPLTEKQLAQLQLQLARTNLASAAVNVRNAVGLALRPKPLIRRFPLLSIGAAGYLGYRLIQRPAPQPAPAVAGEKVAPAARRWQRVVKSATLTLARQCALALFSAYAPSPKA